MASQRYIFPSALIEGMIKSRPNRFIMMVDLDGKIEKCHCPSTGRIGSLRFEGIPCLLSKGDGAGRKTGYTVEAISLDPPDKKSKRWVGIHQGKANAYVGFFLEKGLMPRLFGPVASLKREVRLGGSRLDFLVNEKDYLEVKTPLRDIPCEGHPSYKKSNSKFTGYERLVKHFGDISGPTQNGSRAVVLLCYMYDALPFAIPEAQERAIVDAARKAAAGGVEHWQANLKLDETGVGLTRYFPLELF